MKNITQEVLDMARTKKRNEVRPQTVTREQMLMGSAVDEYELAKERGYGKDDSVPNPKRGPTKG